MVMQTSDVEIKVTLAQHENYSSPPSSPLPMSSSPHSELALSSSPLPVAPSAEFGKPDEAAPEDVEIDDILTQHILTEDDFAPSSSPLPLTSSPLSERALSSSPIPSKGVSRAELKTPDLEEELSKV